MPSVQVEVPSALGTGAFIAPDLVVTAAHVVHPKGRLNPYPPSQVSITLPDGTKLKAIKLWSHERWRNNKFNVTSDMAIVRVKPMPTLVLATGLDLDADDLAVDVLGFREAPRDGHVTREADPDGHDTYASNDLAFHAGVSGAPIVDSSGRAIGIATRSPDLPLPDAFIGLPFLANNLGWLLDNSP